MACALQRQNLQRPYHQPCYQFLHALANHGFLSQIQISSNNIPIPKLRFPRLHRPNFFSHAPNFLPLTKEFIQLNSDLPPKFWWTKLGRKSPLLHIIMIHRRRPLSCPQLPQPLSRLRPPSDISLSTDVATITPIWIAMTISPRRRRGLGASLAPTSQQGHACINVMDVNGPAQTVCRGLSIKSCVHTGNQHLSGQKSAFPYQNRALPRPPGVVTTTIHSFPTSPWRT